MADGGNSRGAVAREPERCVPLHAVEQCARDLGKDLREARLAGDRGLHMRSQAGLNDTVVARESAEREPEVDADSGERAVPDRVAQALCREGLGAGELAGQGLGGTPSVGHPHHWSKELTDEWSLQRMA